jgi:hypothetical protein
MIPEVVFLEVQENIDTPGWYYVDETENYNGPFATEALAKASRTCYLRSLNSCKSCED